MAVWKLKGKRVLDFSLPTIAETSVLPFVVTRVSGEQFAGNVGDTVTLKVGELRARARDYEWRTRTAPIQFDDIYGGGYFPIKINKHVYSATKLTDEHLRMDEVNFAAEVAEPQAKAIGKDYEAKVLTAFRAANAKHKFTGTGQRFMPGTDPHLVALELRRLMDAEKRVPASGRVFLVGTDIAAEWLSSERLTSYDKIGQVNIPAVRDGIIGQFQGSPVIVHNELDPNEGFYLHNSSLVVASLAPYVPAGVSWGTTRSNSMGQALRLIRDYDANFLTDRAIMSTYLGTNEFRDSTDANGEWIFETGEVDPDDLAQMFPSGSVPTLQPVGTRKNVRIIPFKYEGLGSVLPEDALGGA